MEKRCFPLLFYNAEFAHCSRGNRWWSRVFFHRRFHLYKHQKFSTLNQKTHKNWYQMANIAWETKATMINYTDEDEDEMFCTLVYCLETLLPMRESRGTLSSSVIWFGWIIALFQTFLRSLSFLFEITPPHCLFIFIEFFSPSLPQLRDNLSVGLINTSNHKWN